jgi:tRNA A-37 threonylcarbamoyl transferase component Bud32/tetratricopeptide (TPR) repeat protein
VECLDEGRVLAFLEGRLLARERADVEAHLASCAPCTELATWAAAEIANRSRASRREGRPFVGQLAPGSQVGRYQILGAVGRGGMGEVYAAYHPDLDRRIALKVVGQWGADSAELRARLLREARAIARLSHPNVVTVHDAGTVGDRVYIAMEFIDGVTLDQWVASSPQAWERVLDVFMGAGRGLAAAHAAGIVHRDFKPQNVMIAKDGAVRVMDFGLARLVGDVAAGDVDVEAARAAIATPATATVTKTGAVIGTPAYMAPEQFRGEPPDARADQFSFCVALFEALFRFRPAISTQSTADTTKDALKGSMRGSVPAWLHDVLLRGLSADPARRHVSMNALLAALAAGRSGPRRRLSVAAAVAAALLVSLAGWKIARGDRITCEVPEDRLAAAWSGKSGDPRREQVRRAFLASGREQAETSWQRVSAALDEYASQWRAMYVQTCQATNVRGDQSAEVLDLRMNCLGHNLDQLAGLTNTLITADQSAVGQAVMATMQLTPVARCADVALLKSAVPLPRDDVTLRKVQALRRTIAQIEVLRDVGSLPEALRKARALRLECEATGYKPLLAQLLEIVGVIESTLEPLAAESTLEEAFVAAEEGRDDATAARAAADLVCVGSREGRERDATRWARVANALLERLGRVNDRTRSWVAQNQGSNAWLRGDFAGALQFFKQAVALKERELGPEHPDVGISVVSVGIALTELGHLDEALKEFDRGLAIASAHGDPDGPFVAGALNCKGELLRMMGRNNEARALLERSVAVYDRFPAQPPQIGSPLESLGEMSLSEGDPLSARAPLERAARIFAEHNVHPGVTASVRFALARAIWQSGGDKRVAHEHATWARKAFSNYGRTKQAHVVDEWLATHAVKGS